MLTLIIHYLVISRLWLCSGVLVGVLLWCTRWQWFTCYLGNTPSGRQSIGRQEEWRFL